MKTSSGKLGNGDNSRLIFFKYLSKIKICSGGISFGIVFLKCYILRQKGKILIVYPSFMCKFSPNIIQKLHFKVRQKYLGVCKKAKKITKCYYVNFEKNILIFKYFLNIDMFSSFNI